MQLEKRLTTVSPELMAVYREAESAERTNVAEVSRLATKAQTLSASIQTLAAAITQTGSVKDAALSAHAIDQATASELSAARDDHDVAVKNHAEALELLAAVEKARGTAAGQTSKLNNLKLQAARRIWREIHANIVQEIRLRAGDLYLMGEVVVQKLGGGVQNSPFVGLPAAQYREEAQKLEQAVFGS